MSNYTILTDSSCNLPDSIIERYDLKILSLRYMSDTEEHLSYTPDAPTDLSAFYRNMRNGVVYTTSLPFQQESTDSIRSLLDAGQDILYVGFSSALSGTYEATESILRELAPEYPDRKILCIDTLAAAMGEGLAVLQAAEMREEGAPIEDVHAWLVEHRLHIAHWFTVDDLIYLYRGGRVSRTSATAGNILSIKPVLQVNDEGRLIPMEKVRGRKRSIQALYKHLKESFDPGIGMRHIGISHGDCQEDLDQLVSLIEGDEQFEGFSIVTNLLDSVIGAHAGPGTLALFYPATSRN